MYKHYNVPLSDNTIMIVSGGYTGDDYLVEYYDSSFKKFSIPIVHNTTYDALRDVSPLLGSRSGLDTNEDSMDVIATKLAELFVEEEK